MNQLKQQIQQGEQMLTEYNGILEKIKTLQEVKDDKAMLEFLLDIQKLEIESRALNVSAKLAKLKNDYALQFERDSAICNISIDKLIAEGMKFTSTIGYPEAIINKIRTLISAWNIDLDQEKKNDIYFELKAAIDFLNNDYKK
jgi:hypothetical protein